MLHVLIFHQLDCVRGERRRKRRRFYVAPTVLLHLILSAWQFARKTEVRDRVRRIACVVKPQTTHAYVNDVDDDVNDDNDDNLKILLYEWRVSLRCPPTYTNSSFAPNSSQKCLRIF